MVFFISVFTIALILILYGYKIGKHFTIKQAKEKGLQERALKDQLKKEEEEKTYKYF